MVCEDFHIVQVKVCLHQLLSCFFSSYMPPTYVETAASWPCPVSGAATTDVELTWSDCRSAAVSALTCEHHEGVKRAMFVQKGQATLTFSLN